MARVYVANYSEVVLKGKNRHQFVAQLRRNIGRALSQVGEATIESKDGRFIISTEAEPERVSDRLAKVFGLEWFAEATVVPAELEAIRDAVRGSSASLTPSGTFMISAKRADKSFPLNSMELGRILGYDVASRTGSGVRLKNPDSVINVDVLRGRALVYTEKQQGLGGLPVGTGGRVMHLFSGGIDSPVAAWLLMKRGCKPINLHFYLAPTPDYAIKSKITGLLRVLAQFCGRSTLVLLPFAEYQLATSDLRGDLEPSLFRRFMRMTAEALAPRFGALAISTGDALSQAASQTTWNLRSFDLGSTLPILRPLLAWDKQEIVDFAKKIGTYDLSAEEYKDCCAIITRHPKTRVDPLRVSKLAEEADFPTIVKRCIAGSTLVSYNPARDETRVQALSDWQPTHEERRDQVAGIPEA